MNCPNDNTTLVMTERSGIELDYCPQCRGIWLDRGELDKLIDRGIESMGPGAQTYHAVPQTSGTPGVQSSRPIAGQEYFTDQEVRSRFEGPNYRDDDHKNHDEYYKGHYDPHHKKRRKESFLGDIFDF